MMNNIKAVRREDLFQDDASQADDNLLHHARGEEDDGTAAAARAALDAYMKNSLGLDIGIPVPQPKPKPKPIIRKGDEDHDDSAMSDEAIESSDDDEDEEKSSKKITKKKHDSKAPAPQAGGATEFEFRLFAGSGRAATAAKKDADTPAAAEGPTAIVLLDDALGPATGPGGLLNPPRPLSTYIAGEPTADELARYAQAAVEGEDVMAQAAASNRAWGLEVPWRARTVVQVPKSALRALLSNALPAGQSVPADLSLALSSAVNALPSWAAAALSSSSQSPEPAAPRLLSRHLPEQTERKIKHCRPGKKSRIILRRREQVRLEKAAAAAAQKQSKEEHLSEKKKRLNRAKKLRRRDKKRAEKTGGEGSDGDGNDGNDGNESADDSGGD